ncbi:MAG: FecR domain-containing protein [Leptolyngbyaceae cyanobacterium MO_188.B28]|nr:FecR domain-containing protein [Leptolyngbyaceae cyanobacterium MO_188.B28]
MKCSVIMRLGGLLWVLGLFISPHQANAQASLQWAQVESLRNRVDLIPQGRSARPAQISDVMGVGDALRTAQAARAELRFNEGSLARIGERAVFRFSPNTRNFRLSNGTVLLLIPAGRGRSTIQTPNTVTGIQGSALFVRVDLETNSTLIGALTDNPAGPMMVYNQDGSQQHPLNAGEMVRVEGNQITHFYRFDLQRFYDTSSLVKGLNLTDPNIDPNSSDPTAVVQAETSEALAEQEPVTGEDVIENPDFIGLTDVEGGAATLAETVPFPNLPPMLWESPTGVEPGFTLGQPNNPSYRPDVPSGLPSQTGHPSPPSSGNGSGGSVPPTSTGGGPDDQPVIVDTPTLLPPPTTDD